MPERRNGRVSGGFESADPRFEHEVALVLLPGFGERLLENLFGHALGHGCFLGADPILGLPVLLAIVGWQVDKKILGPPPDSWIRSGFLTQDAGLAQRRVVGIEGAVNVVSMIYDVPFHGIFSLRRTSMELDD